MRTLWLSGLVALVVLGGGRVHAQTSVRGVVVDSTSGQVLAGATVLALGADSTRVGASADADGAFALMLPDGRHQLRASFVGYLTTERTVTVSGSPLDLGRLVLRPDTTELDETLVEAVETRVEIRGDTTAFNAGAYGVNPDATAGDLVGKLPGMSVENGEVRANGEAVEQVLVDGREFFGEDPSTALDNLPADAVEEVQVYDRASDQAELTGFDDGEEQRTINIVTKPERRRSLFGTAHGGVGSDRRYAAGATVNRFAGDRRLSVRLNANNIDPQTLSSLQGESERPGVLRFTRTRDGIARTLSGSANLNDQWGETVEVSGSYSLSGSGTTRDVALSRDYVLSDAAGQRYSETTDADRDVVRHNLFSRAEIQLSEQTELRLQPRLSLMTNRSDNLLGAQTALPVGGLLSRSQTASTGDGLDYSANLNATLSHKFSTEGRAVSGQLRLSTNQDDSDSEQDIERSFFLADGVGVDSVTAFGRRVGREQGSRTVSGELTYSEPIAEGLQVLASYTPSLSVRDAEQDGFRLDDAGQFTVLDSAFTSISDQQVVAHRAGVQLQRRSEALTGTVGLSAEHERLTYEQGGPRAFDVDRATVSILPSARIQYKLGERSTLNLNYRSSTRTPRATQLRDVIDDSNPLLVTDGNPDLRTARTHQASFRFRTASPEAGTSFSGSLNLRATRDYIGTATVAAGADTVRFRGTVLTPGAQLRYPVNLDGYLSAFSFLSYGRPVKLLKSNLNAFATLGYSRTPSLQGDILDRTDALTTTVRVSLGTNASERFDLSTYYDISARIASYSASPSRSPRSVRHGAGGTLSWLPTGSLVVRSKLALGYDADIGGDLDPLTTRLDLGVGYKFLANDQAEVRLTVADVFDQNTSVSRRVTDQYVEDRQSLALGRFVLVNLTYTIRPAGGPRRPAGGPVSIPIVIGG